MKAKDPLIERNRLQAVALAKEQLVGTEGEIAGERLHLASLTEPFEQAFTHMLKSSRRLRLLTKEKERLQVYLEELNGVRRPTRAPQGNSRSKPTHLKREQTDTLNSVDELNLFVVLFMALRFAENNSREDGLASDVFRAYQGVTKLQLARRLSVSLPTVEFESFLVRAFDAVVENFAVSGVDDVQKRMSSDEDLLYTELGNLARCNRFYKQEDELRPVVADLVCRGWARWISDTDAAITGLGRAELARAVDRDESSFDFEGSDENNEIADPSEDGEDREAGR